MHALINSIFNYAPVNGIRQDMFTALLLSCYQALARPKKSGIYS